MITELVKAKREYLFADFKKMVAFNENVPSHRYCCGLVGVQVCKCVDMVQLFHKNQSFRMARWRLLYFGL
jgi:hypothetical protein